MMGVPERHPSHVGKTKNYITTLELKDAHIDHALWRATRGGKGKVMILRDRSLRGMVLDMMDFSNVMLRGADLRAAAMTNCNLAAADLVDADLYGVDLRHCRNIQSAHYRNTLTGQRGFWELTQNPPIVLHLPDYPVIIWDQHASVGCCYRPLYRWFHMSVDDAIGEGRSRGEQPSVVGDFFETMRDFLITVARRGGRDVANIPEQYL